VDKILQIKNFCSIFNPETGVGRKVILHVKFNSDKLRQTLYHNINKKEKFLKPDPDHCQNLFLLLQGPSL